MRILTIATQSLVVAAAVVSLSVSGLVLSANAAKAAKAIDCGSDTVETSAVETDVILIAQYEPDPNGNPKSDGTGTR